MIYPTKKQWGYSNTFATAGHYDIKCQAGTEVFAPENILIIFAGIDNYGARTIIGTNGNRRWEIGHFSELIRHNGMVGQGELIGLSGGWPPLPGEQTSGPHLHVRLLVNNISIDWVKLYEEEQNQMSELEDLKKWLKDTGNVARDALRQMGVPNYQGLSDTDAVKVLRDYGINYYKETKKTRQEVWNSIGKSVLT